MTAASEKQALERIARSLRTLGRQVRPAQDPETKEDPRVASDAARASARESARHLALHFDKYWPRSRIIDTERPIDVVDMFSGCGGMSTGFSAVSGLIPSYRLTAAFDIDHVANRTYQTNLGMTPFAEDISALARAHTRLTNILDSSGRRRGNPWVLIGCAPCQGFSSHRNRAGHGDPRNSLFVDFSRIAARLQPTAVVVENVPELLTDQYWPYVREARRTLEGAGYYVHISVHNMAEYGVPQERFRALILALKHPFLPPQGFLGREDFRTVRKAIGDLPRVAAGCRIASDPMHYSAGHKDSTLRVIRAVPKDGGNRPDNMGPACLRRAKERNGRAAYEDVYGRLHWDRPSITVTAYARNPASGRYVHPEQDRGLTIREAALLQGFPKGYSFSGSLDQNFRQVGNAVPPIFAGFVATYLLGELTGAGVTEAAMSGGIERPIASSFSRIIPALKAGHRTSNGSQPTSKGVP